MPNTVSSVLSAYRPHHNSEAALLKVTNDILLAFDSGNVSLLTNTLGSLGFIEHN